MNIPGFTAELALYRINDYHHMAILSMGNQESILPAQFGGIPAPEGPDFPDFPSGIPNLSEILRLREFCFYPCQRICLPPRWGGWCFYPCKKICVWG